MHLLDDALRAGRSGRRNATAAQAVLVVGGGGALGSAVVERLLAARRLAPVRVLVTRPLQTAAHGLEAWPAAAILAELDAAAGTASATDPATEPDPSADRFGAPSAPATGVPVARSAVVVFGRQRRSNGREDAFVQPSPEALPALSRGLWRCGVRHLVVVLPHDPARLPLVLRAGLANLDEQAVAALGFEHLVLVRPAEIGSGARAGRWLQRVADGVLAQLRLMQPASEQPVRVAKVAEFVVELAQRLPTSAPGTRVAGPSLLWQAAQQPGCGELVAAWLAGRTLPAVAVRRMRL